MQPITAFHREQTQNDAQLFTQYSDYRTGWTNRNSRFDPQQGEAHTGFAPPSLYTKSTRCLAPGRNLSGGEAEQVAPFSAEVKNTWCLTSTLSYISMPLC